MNVWTFDSTGDGYDQSQVDDRIRDGDVLVVKAERVAGFLYQAWPVAVTVTHGAFHTLAVDVDPRTFEGGRYADAVARAEQEVARWPT